MSFHTPLGSSSPGHPLSWRWRMCLLSLCRLAGVGRLMILRAPLIEPLATSVWCRRPAMLFRLPRLRKCRCSRNSLRCHKDYRMCRIPMRRASYSSAPPLRLPRLNPLRRSGQLALVAQLLPSPRLPPAARLTLAGQWNLAALERPWTQSPPSRPASRLLIRLFPSLNLFWGRRLGDWLCPDRNRHFGCRKLFRARRSRSRWSCRSRRPPRLSRRGLESLECLALLSNQLPRQALDSLAGRLRRFVPLPPRSLESLECLARPPRPPGRSGS